MKDARWEGVGEDSYPSFLTAGRQDLHLVVRDGKEKQERRTGRRIKDGGMVGREAVAQ